MAKPFTVKFKIEGARALRQQLKQLQQDYPEAANAAVFREGYGVFIKAQELTPVDTGNLRGTAIVNPTTKSDGLALFEIIYPANYALIVHELHATHSKFLETPLMNAASGMAGRMRDYIVSKVKV